MGKLDLKRAGRGVRWKRREKLRGLVVLIGDYTEDEEATIYVTKIPLDRGHEIPKSGPFHHPIFLFALVIIAVEL